MSRQTAPTQTTGLLQGIRAHTLELGGLLIAIAAALFCVHFFLRWLHPWLLFPADLLMWAETGFVQNILKLQGGIPLYLPPEDSNSVIYTPATPVLTYALLKLVGSAVSVPAMRIVQFGFVVLATLMAFQNLRWHRRLAERPSLGPASLLYAGLAGALLFLAATAPQVNRFVWMLHADGLSLLLSVVAWGALLAYVLKPSLPRLLAFGVTPAIGFAIKPFLLCWGPIGAVVVAILHLQDPRRMFKELVILTSWTTGLFLAIYGLFYWLWGSNFVFWVFDIMGGPRRGLSWNYAWNVGVGRSLDHVMQAWWELSFGGAAIWLGLRKALDRRVVALSAGWLMLIGFEAFTSGSSWNVLYHFGPAVLIGLAWLLAVLPEQFRFFERDPDAPMFENPGPRLARVAGGIAVVFAIGVALRVVPSYHPDADRHPWAPGPESLLAQSKAIEAEFEGYADHEVLLDMGSWVHMDSGHIAKDRSPALADQPPGEIYSNFPPLIERLASHHYKKLLMRDYHEIYFLYDWSGWTQSTGVKAAIDEHYTEVRLIPAAEKGPAVFAGAVSVFVPKEKE